MMTYWNLYTSVPNLLKTPSHIKSSFICLINYCWIYYSDFVKSTEIILPSMMLAFRDILSSFFGEFYGDWMFYFDCTGDYTPPR